MMPNEHTENWPFDRHRHQWNKEEAVRRAREEGIDSLTESHWRLIHQLREFFDTYHSSPSMHALCHAYKLEPNCVESLFGNAREAWYISGLPEPGEEEKSYL